jgi:hypothetical protein
MFTAVAARHPNFAADQPFAQARLKLLEHYGFAIGESTIQRIALGHAQALFEAGQASQDFPETPGRHQEIVAQTDGGMIPIVTPDESQKDKRKGKALSWREAKLCLAHGASHRLGYHSSDKRRRLFSRRKRRLQRSQLSNSRTGASRRGGNSRHPRDHQRSGPTGHPLLQVEFSLFESLAKNHQPQVSPRQSIDTLHGGLRRMGFCDREFRNSIYVRSKLLEAHMSAGRLTVDPRWSDSALQESDQ